MATALNSCILKEETRRERERRKISSFALLLFDIDKRLSESLAQVCKRVPDGNKVEGERR